MSASDIRRESAQPMLDERMVDPDPIKQFGRWMEDALSADIVEPTAATLATADRAAHPSARIVLLKEYEAGGLVFYTNYRSRKGLELSENPAAALVCYWVELWRQIVICGSVVKIPPEESDRYFATRLRGSQLGAWVSEQSQVIDGREILERRLAEFDKTYQERDIPRPPHWGGYRLVPNTIEFWQGRKDRLHDRILYTRQEDGSWRIERLAP